MGQRILDLLQSVDDVKYGPFPKWMNWGGEYEKANPGADWSRTRMVGWSGIRGCCYFWFSGWSHVSLGLHLDWISPNMEIHVPFGFFRVGMHGIRRRRMNRVHARENGHDL